MANPSSIVESNLPSIALVGRVNVGKSKLFNKLVEEQKAIVSDIAGTTRTNNEGILLWRGKQINVIDTGGLTFDEDVPFEDDIIKQSEYAIKNASVVVFVTDIQTGVLPQERELAKKLRKKNIPIILVANKADSVKHERAMNSGEWASLGLGEPMPISAASGKNVGDFLDVVYSHLQKQKVRPKIFREKDDKIIDITIIGKPNAGKSSLFNKIVGQEKVIVSEKAHTTREPFDTTVDYHYKLGAKEVKQKINFVDTAGIRRKSKVSGELERAGIHKSIVAVESSDIVLFVLDGSETISSQDKQLGGLLEKRGKSIIILINKWDLAEERSDLYRQAVKKMVYSHFPHIKFAPILFVSGKTGYRVHDIFPLIMKVWRARHTTIPVKALEYFLEGIMRQHKPSRGKGTRQPKLLGIRQLASGPPVIEVVVKYRTSIHRSYINFIKNKMREQFDFEGSPIIMKLRKMKR
jgi:GTPase